MAEEPLRSQSIRDRIAALNLGQVGRSPPSPPLVRYVHPSDPPPPPPTQRSERLGGTVTETRSKSKTANNPINEAIHGRETNCYNPTTPNRTSKALPPLPTRRSPGLPPSLPVRKSLTLARKASIESTSALSNVSSLSTKSRSTSRNAPQHRIRAPAYDPTSLPPLPPKANQETYLPPAPGKLNAVLNDSSHIKTVKSQSNNRVPIKHTPTLPPPVPVPPRNLPPVLSTQDRLSALSLGFNRQSSPPVIPKTQPEFNGSRTNLQQANEPPPIPLNTRPDLSKILATKPTIAVTKSTNVCLKCHDFSGPDNHATKYPRQSLATQDLGWLADQLTAPFPSPTDKARVIFKWLHHNIRYDVDAFFNNRVKSSTPASILSTGLAVCEGFAGLFTALASRAGLESFVISGHGKGFGFVQVVAGQPVPPFSSNHAWNVVKIDNEEWKLVDCCWGAGNIAGKGKPYNQQFCPVHFVMDNNEFGLRHFPTNKGHFFRVGNRTTISWEEYILSDPSKPGGVESPQVFNLVGEEGFHKLKFLPASKVISVQEAMRLPAIRFQFERLCSHWNPVRNGKGKAYQYIMCVHGEDGQKDEFVPFETNGRYWWCDVCSNRLGTPGQTITAFAVVTIQGQTGRGLSLEEYKKAQGRKAMGFGGLVAWKLA